MLDHVKLASLAEGSTFILFLAGLEDPVRAEDGYIYERVCISSWIAIKHTSPMTNEPLTDRTLTPAKSTITTMQEIAGHLSPVARQCFLSQNPQLIN